MQEVVGIKGWKKFIIFIIIRYLSITGYNCSSYHYTKPPYYSFIIIRYLSITGYNWSGYYYTKPPCYC